ncbi:MAG TPA: glycosyltransferase family 39 protein [Opitutaceae bacterium]
MRRILLFSASGAAAVYVGYRAVPTIAAGHLIIAWGYFYMLAVFSLFVGFALRVARTRREVWTGWLRRPGAGGLAIGLGFLFALWGDTFRHKILFDEFVIQGTAYEMHLTKLVSTIVRAYDVNGTWLTIDTILDKRPYFFPFLVSLVHDFTGFRMANMFAVNAALAGAVLALLYWFVRQLAGRGPAILSVALMATLPLFCQNASGAASDMCNLAMIALVACLATLYLRAPGDDRLTLLVLGCILLVQSRYESVIYVVPTAAVIAIGWARAGRVILPWPVIIAPLLLVPYAWHSRVLASEPIFWQLQEGQTSAFALSNISGNFDGDVAFLFNTGVEMPNSWYLSGLGVLGLAWLAYPGWERLRRRPRPRLSPAAVVGTAFGAGIVVHFIILLFYWWAKFNDSLASRFALPMCLGFSVLAAVLIRDLGRWRLPALRIASIGLGVWLAAGGIPAMARRLYTEKNLAMQEIQWEHAFIASRPGPVLVISNKSTIPFVLWRIECVIAAVGAQKGEDIRFHMSQHTFNEVLVTQAIRPTSGDGDMGVDPNDVMPPNYHLEMLAEKRFGIRLDRISRIVSIDPAPGGEKEPGQRVLTPSALRSISALQSLREPAVAALTSSAVRR